MKCPAAQLRRRVRGRWRAMQRPGMSGSGLSLAGEGGSVISAPDKGNCGVSVYGAALIASRLKDPTYGTLIDS